ncbi:RTA1 like protein-domain-containing protein [Crucibulum laeve]|uniref:RTA1 like protein-domain-containing protein n=1 Tax=Crucibulum laeve TaxID=68775 RepID=A0A5C3LEV2_9AGAR|nr:RTA1 like protein-domain-containing protein [Crucibulum laeve]
MASVQHPRPLRSPYHYTPTEGVAITFIVLFSISTLIHTGQSIRSRIWWLFPTACLCGILEVLGWVARLWSSFNVTAKQPFEMQITATIIAPTPFVAANFIILGMIIDRLGPQYSRLSSAMYARIFLTCDIISLVVQGVGGGMAASAFGRNMDPAMGGHIMLGGIAFQLTTISVYTLLASEFFFRYFRDRPIRPATVEKFHAEGIDTRTIIVTTGLIFSTICLLIRAVYRTIELSDGWSGRIISTQVYFNVLDGGMITLAMFTLNLAHPGLLPALRAERKVVSKDGDSSTTEVDKAA